MWQECPLFRKLHEPGAPHDVYLRRLQQGMWAFNSHHPQHDHKFATACSKDKDKLRPQDVTSWKALNADKKMRLVESINCIEAAPLDTASPRPGCDAPASEQASSQTQQVHVVHNSLSLKQKPPAPLWDADRLRLCADNLPPDFRPFTVGEPYALCQVEASRSQRAPARSYLDGIPAHLLFKFSQVVKDKDVALLNSTTTDSVVPDGELVAHTNCIAHTHMHLAKMAPGALVDKSALPYALAWLKKIDEQNKVRL
jgi:hypothetical protein